MSDKRPIDTLREKDASELSLTDYLIGHDNGAPAGYRTQLAELASALDNPLGDSLPNNNDFMQSLITAIIGPVESNANGSYVRLENGLQICWGQRTLVYANGDLVQETWTHPAPFNANPVTLASIRDITYGGNLTRLTVVRANTAPNTSLLRVYRTVGYTDFAPGDNVVVNVLAVGTWK